MGVNLTTCQAAEKEFIRDRCSSGRRSFYAIQSIGCRLVPLVPEISSMLYWRICIPRMLYGLEVFTLSDSSLQQLERTHSAIAKHIQGLPKQTASAGCVSTLGWSSIGAQLDIIRMVFVWRLLLRPASCIYKIVLIARLWFHLYHECDKNAGPTYKIVKIFRKYGLTDILINAVESGVIMSLLEFKRYAKYVVNEHETQCFKATCIMHPTLQLFTECICSLEVWKWWSICSLCPELTYKVKVIARILFQQTCFAGSTYRFIRNATKSCQMCDTYTEESAEHVLFECRNNAYELRRDDFNVKLRNNAPAALWLELNAMAPRDKLTYILSCLNSSLVPEWIPTYVICVNFLYDMYIIRSKYFK
jgi:hypothetical protein